ncbi:hypothetical protein WR25_15945 [Diploscapter pachys]|uniref:Inhibitor of growth protein n=1 Tax=Diploscapter pachys TaxID=2018661 RepID=A0A2A2LBJ2_9BILA|nr:hypothetical protein WR25_15945 [Diploscapter pachys]
MAESLRAYMSKLDHLPPTIRKFNDEIRDLDSQVINIQDRIKKKTLAYANKLASLNKDDRMKFYKEIQDMYKEGEKMAEKKVKIAEKMYDLIDKHITEMDAEMSQFNSVQHSKLSDNKKKSEISRGRGRPAAGSRNLKTKKSDLKAPAANVMSAFKHAVPPVEMPVDPNEPIYCVCHQVSFGQMVACDNKECKTEWFHFQCVGLTESPKGEWYCDDCKDLVKKKKKRHD